MGKLFALVVVVVVVLGVLPSVHGAYREDMDAAIVVFDGGDFVQAQGLFESVIATYPTATPKQQFHAKLYVGRCYEGQGMRTEAETMYREVADSGVRGDKTRDPERGRVVHRTEEASVARGIQVRAQTQRNPRMRLLRIDALSTQPPIHSLVSIDALLSAVPLAWWVSLDTVATESPIYDSMALNAVVESAPLTSPLLVSPVTMESPIYDIVLIDVLVESTPLDSTLLVSPVTMESPIGDLVSLDPQLQRTPNTQLRVSSAITTEPSVTWLDYDDPISTISFVGIELKAIRDEYRLLPQDRTMTDRQLMEKASALQPWIERHRRSIDRRNRLRIERGQ